MPLHGLVVGGEEVVRARDEAHGLPHVEHVLRALEPPEAEDRGRLLLPDGAVERDGGDRACRASPRRRPSRRRATVVQAAADAAAARRRRRAICADLPGARPVDDRDVAADEADVERARRRPRGRRRRRRSAVPSRVADEVDDRPRAAVAVALVAAPEGELVAGAREDLDALRRAAPACPRRCSAGRRRSRLTIVSKNVSTTRTCAVVVV